MTQHRSGSRRQAWCVPICIAVTMLATSVSRATAANAVTEWNAFSTELFTLQPTGLLDSRIYSIQHAAIHDALNTIKSRFRRYTRCEGVVAFDASPTAAVAQASRDVLAALWATNVWANPPLAPPTLQATIQAMIENRYQSALAAIPANDAKERGKAIGAACARANLDKRADDGLGDAGPPFSATPIYIPGTAPGDYQFTPPYDAPPFGPLAAGPGWGNLTPFAFDLSKHKVARPLRLSSHLYAADLNFVKEIGRADSTTRTAEQSEIAVFWYESSVSGWNRIANTVLTGEGLGAWQSARILALVNFAMADGYIAGFDAKYRFNFWRPITAIRMAALDGNALTDPDPGWNSFCENPPIPDHPSTHTVLGAAAAEVLIQHFGNRLRFSVTSASLPNVTRRYRGFTEPAIENGLSRVYCGIHFLHAVREGYDLGRAIGRLVSRKLPIHGN
jgi:membrane-associated phospholipid phosphatase